MVEPALAFHPTIPTLHKSHTTATPDIFVYCPHPPIEVLSMTYHLIRLLPHPISLLLLFRQPANAVWLLEKALGTAVIKCNDSTSSSLQTWLTLCLVSTFCLVLRAQGYFWGFEDSFGSAHIIRLIPPPINASINKVDNLLLWFLDSMGPFGLIHLNSVVLAVAQAEVDRGYCKQLEVSPFTCTQF